MGAHKNFLLTIFPPSLDVLSCAPQGSILGPLLFNICTSEILCSVPNARIQAYADDSVLYSHFPIDNTVEAGNMIRLELNKIMNLFIEHDLNLNS